MNSSLISSRKYGWIPDIPDTRDYSYIRFAKVLPVIPAYIDLRKECSKIEDQGTLGSCTACALVGNLEFLKKKMLNKILDFSKLFLYYNERVLRNNVRVDSGASIRDGLKSLAKLGDCPEKMWPYIVSKFSRKPPLLAFKSAKDYQITSYFRIRSLDEMKHTISTGFPFVFGFMVYESFESDYMRRTGNMQMPEPDEEILGGHAVMGVGYDDDKETCIVRNSWGSDWGDNGYFYMPYKYISNPRLSSDFWTIRDME